MRSFEIRAAFDKVFKELQVIKSLLREAPLNKVQVDKRFLPTVVALSKLGGSGTATLVSEITGRTRAIESQKLNELAGRGLITKKVSGRSRIFILEEES